MEQKNVLIIGGGAVWSLFWYHLQSIEGYWVDVLLKPWQPPLKSIQFADTTTHIPHFGQSSSTDDTRYDLVIVATKAHDTDRAHREADYFAKPTASILTIQSWMHDYEPLRDRHSQAIAYVNALKDGDTVYMYSPRMRLVIDEWFWFESLLQNSSFLHLEQVEDFDRFKWEKFAHIACFSAIVCREWKSIWAIRSDDVLFQDFNDLLGEALRVASSYWYIFEKESFLTKIQKTPWESYTSLYHDLQQQKRGELDILIWKMISLAKINDIKTPFFDQALDIIIKKYNIV